MSDPSPTHEHADPVVPSPIAPPSRSSSPSPSPDRVMSATPPAPPGTAVDPTPAPATLGGARRRAAGDDRGQASAEYGLVIIVAATIAVAIIAWATQSGAITGFFDAVVERLTGFL